MICVCNKRIKDGLGQCPKCHHVFSSRETCSKCGAMMKKIGCLPPECGKCRDKEFEKIVRSRGGYFNQPKDRTYCRSASDGSLYTYSEGDNVSMKCRDERIIYQEEYDMGSSAWLDKYGPGPDESYYDMLRCS